MKTLRTIASVALCGFASSTALAQVGGMMNADHGGMWGSGWMARHGGLGWPLLLVVVVGVLIFTLAQRRK